MNYLNTGLQSGNIEILEHKNRTAVIMQGEIDCSLKDQAGASIAIALGRYLPVIIDTSAVTFIDSTGVASLIQFCEVGAQEGVEVYLVKPPTVVTDVLEMLDMINLFNCIEDEKHIQLTH